MQTQSIEINGKLYPLKFGYGAFRALGILWKVSGPEEVGEKISKAFKGGDGIKFKFEQMDVLNDLIYSAIIAFNPKNVKLKKEITSDDIGTAIMQDPEKATEILTLYTEALSVGKVGKPKPMKAG